MMGPSAEAAEVGTVCVTGAAGYLAAHVVRGLLDRGHRVRGSVRSLGDQAKTAPLRALPGAAERLELAEADLMEPAGFPALLRGCRTLIHTATPIHIPLDGSVPASSLEEAQRLQICPAVDGTRALLEAAEKAGVQKVVLTSSIAAMRFTRPPPAVLDESCWSDEQLMREKLFESPPACYALAKTLQERAAWRAAEGGSFRLIVINPALIIGPSLMPHLNFSLEALVSLGEGRGSGLDSCRPGTLPDMYKGWVDVREVSEAHVLAAESPEAEGRYLLQSSVTHYAEIYDAMRRHPRFSGRPDLPIDSKDGRRNAAASRMDNSKMRALGVRVIPVEQSVADSIASLEAGGFFEPRAKAPKL